MEKAKPTPWEGKKKMFKDGDPDVFRGFNWQTWKNMTEGERSMWTESSEIARAPISKEVLDFKKKEKIAGLNHVAAEEILNEVISEKNAEAEEAFASKATLKLTELDKVKAELVERGIKFSYNSKLETLQKKLADADNTE